MKYLYQEVRDSPKTFVSLTSNTGIYLLITVVDCFSGVEFVPIEDQQVFEVEGATLTAIHTPGHTTDHVVLHLKVSYRHNRKQTFLRGPVCTGLSFGYLIGVTALNSVVDDTENF